MTWPVVRWRHSAAALALLVAGAPALAAEPAGYLDGFPRASATLQTSRACYILDLYLAVTPEQRAQGLMFIRELGEYEGMLFTSPAPATVSMWMKNTYVSLDMVFIRADGRIAGIAARTTPLSEATITAPEPVTAVLELNAGFTARHGVRPGDRFYLVLLPAAGIRLRTPGRTGQCQGCDPVSLGI